MKYLVIFISAAVSLFSQPFIRNVYTERRDVFDSTDTRLDLSLTWLNSLHVLTKDYIVRDELLFEPGDEIDDDLIAETERNLRRLQVFTRAFVEFDSVGNDLYDVYVVTQDRWSTTPAAIFGTGGGVSRYGGKVSEKNVLGTATDLEFEAMYRTENDIKWQGRAMLEKTRFLRSEFTLFGQLQAHKFKTRQDLLFYKPYRTLATETSYGINLRNHFGYDFVYDRLDTTLLLPSHDKVYGGYFSRAWIKESRVFLTGYFEYNDVERGLPQFRRAFDNSGKILFQFSSLSQDFFKTLKLNDFKTEDLITGGYGSVTLGKIFPIGTRGGDNLYYVAAEGEQSVYNGKSYLYGRLNASTGFAQGNPKYTSQSFTGLGFHRLTTDLLVAARVQQQTVWRWDAFRQLVLDNDAGLRGYDANTLAGDNRFLSNIELRFFPDWDLWLFNLSTVLFYDGGTVWNQDTPLTKTRWKSSAGVGIRFHNKKATGENSIYRFDFAYNFDENKFGGIIFSTDQLFSIFGNHNFKTPTLFGSEIDEE